jgi:hypothetical protein
MLMALITALQGVFGWFGALGQDEQPQWRDTSLDDWRAERDQAREAERQARASGREMSDGQEQMRESEPVEQERIGG